MTVEGGESPRTHRRTVTPVDAHAALVDAMNQFFDASTGSWSPECVAQYVRRELPDHLLEMGDFEWAMAELERAESWTRASESRDRWGAYAPAFVSALGPLNPLALRAQVMAAFWRGNAGDPWGAAEDLEGLFAQVRYALDPQDTVTWETGIYLARFLQRAQRFQPALDLLERLVPDVESLLGPWHPLSVEARKERDSLYGFTGQVGKARANYEAQVEELIGMGDPFRLEILHLRVNRAMWRRHDGDPEAALAEAVEVLPRAERVWGTEDPRTTTVREVLADCAGDLGDPAAAARAYEELIAVHDRVSGPDHPNTLAARIRHAYWLGYARSDRAVTVTAFSQLLPELIQKLGMEHGHTQFVLSFLAGPQAWAVGISPLDIPGVGIVSPFPAEQDPDSGSRFS